MPAKAENLHSAREINTARRIGRRLISFGAAAASLAAVSTCTDTVKEVPPKRLAMGVVLSSGAAIAVGAALIGEANYQEDQQGTTRRFSRRVR